MIDYCLLPTFSDNIELLEAQAMASGDQSQLKPKAMLFILERETFMTVLFHSLTVPNNLNQPAHASATVAEANVGRADVQAQSAKSTHPALSVVLRDTYGK